VYGWQRLLADAKASGGPGPATRLVAYLLEAWVHEQARQLQLGNTVVFHVLSGAAVKRPAPRWIARSATVSQLHALLDTGLTGQNGLSVFGKMGQEFKPGTDIASHQ